MKPGHLSFVNDDKTITHMPMGKSEKDHQQSKRDLKIAERAHEAAKVARAVSIGHVRQSKKDHEAFLARTEDTLRKYGETGLDVIESAPKVEYHGAQQNNTFAKVRQFLGML
jgi:hypothetical protein